MQETAQTPETSPTRLFTFLQDAKPNILRELRKIIRDNRSDLRKNPELYKETSDSEPTIDVRLALNSFGDSYDWRLHVGSVDFDSNHSEYCGAGQFGVETTADELFEQLTLDFQ